MSSRETHPSTLAPAAPLAPSLSPEWSGHTVSSAVAASPTHRAWPLTPPRPEVMAGLCSSDARPGVPYLHIGSLSPAFSPETTFLPSPLSEAPSSTLPLPPA